MPKKEVTREIATKDLLDLLDDEVAEAGGFKVHHEGGWISNDKYEYRDIIFQEIATGKFYKYVDSRSGSYYTDYHYSRDYTTATVFNIEEVKPVEVTITKWESVYEQ